MLNCYKNSDIERVHFFLGFLIINAHLESSILDLFTLMVPDFFQKNSFTKPNGVNNCDIADSPLLYHWA